MRKKTIYVLATVMCMSIFTACGSTNRADAGNEVQQEVQAEDNMQKEQQAGAEGNAETELQTEAVPESTDMNWPARKKKQRKNRKQLKSRKFAFLQTLTPMILIPK